MKKKNVSIKQFYFQNIQFSDVKLLQSPGQMLFVCIVKLQFLAQFPVDHIPNPVVSSFYSFCTNLLHSLIMGLVVSSLSSHDLNLLFCCILSIFALISSSSCRVASTDIPDPLSPLFLIVHRSSYTATYLPSLKPSN